MTEPNAPAPAFSIRGIPIAGTAILAPMDGYSDWPFRSICRELGSAMSYTEFVRAEDILQRWHYVAPKMHFTPNERPMTIQIYGDNPQKLLEAALRVQELGPDIIDVNMGCPAKTVANRGAGVGLMRTPLKIARTFKLLTRHLEVPVTGKMRLGWEECRTYKLVARIVEENGGSLIAVHGRTKQQAYRGEADWDAIAEVKSLVKIPVIGSGDVRTPQDIIQKKAYAGVDAVMIGRAAIGNPWIFSRLTREQVSQEQLRAMIQKHLERNVAFYGERHGVGVFRKHAAQYISPQSLPRDLRVRLFTQTEVSGFFSVLDEILAMQLPATN
jgi:tRNA-dihydrouridine synthase B